MRGVIEDWNSQMFDRQFLGDLSLAILLALPTAAMAQPGNADKPQTAVTTPVEQTATGDTSPAPIRYSLLARG